MLAAEKGSFREVIDFAIFHRFDRRTPSAMVWNEVTSDITCLPT